MTTSDMVRALAPWPELAAGAGPLLAALQSGARRIELPDLALTLVVGDARATLPGTALSADAWFVDGFAPTRNPELWEPTLLDAVARRTATGGTFATYTAAGDVRRALAGAGIAVERVPGFGTKRHMTRGTRIA